MSKSITPSLAFDGGEAYGAARALLAPLRASLTEAEFSALVSLMRTATPGALDRAFSDTERMAALAATSALTARFGGMVGASEASEVVALAGRYLDAGIVMPPSTAKWKKNIFIALLPDGAEGWLDRMQKLVQDLILPESREYSVDDPPSLLEGEQAAGYRRGIVAVLDHNIEAYIAPASDVASGR